MVEHEGVPDTGGHLGDELERPPMAHSKDKVDAGGLMGTSVRCHLFIYILFTRLTAEPPRPPLSLM